MSKTVVVAAYSTLLCHFVIVKDFCINEAHRFQCRRDVIAPIRDCTFDSVVEVLLQNNPGKIPL